MMQVAFEHSDILKLSVNPIIVGFGCLVHNTLCEIQKAQRTVRTPFLACRYSTRSTSLLLLDVWHKKLDPALGKWLIWYRPTILDALIVGTGHGIVVGAYLCRTWTWQTTDSGYKLTQTRITTIHDATKNHKNVYGHALFSLQFAMAIKSSSKEM